MKKRFTAILMIFIFLNLFISYNVNAISLQEVMENIDLEKDDKELDDMNCNGNVLTVERFCEFLQEKYNISFENTNEVNEEFVENNLELFNEFRDYLNKENIVDEFINDSFQEKFEFSNKHENVDYDDLLEDNSILDNEDSNNINESKEILKECIDNEYCTISYIDDNDKYMTDEINLDKYKSYIDNSDDKILVADSSLQNNIISKSVLPNNENYINDEEKIDVLNLENKNADNPLSNIKISVSDLEIAKNNHEELKITFKIDNSLDLKEDKNNLRIYIANNSSNKEILITKDKSLDEYLYLENTTSISGDILKLGKGDTLLDGMYTVILSDEEQEKVRSIGLENLIVKVEAYCNDKSSSAVGYLKEKDTLEENNSGDVKEDESKSSFLAIDSSNKNSDENKNNTKNTLPKTGMFLGSYLILDVGIFMFLLGTFLVKYKKIGN